MKLLALDTATDLCSAALWLEGEVRTRETLAPRTHGALILPMIEDLLGEAGLALGALDAIAFGRGPGAFTGLRLAAAVAQGLGFAAQLPLLPISDLRALAAQLLAPSGVPRRALICQDARMNEVYWGCFERTATMIRGRGHEAVTPPGAVVLPSEWGGSEGNDLRPGVDGPGADGCQGQAASAAILAAGSGFAAYPLPLSKMVAAVTAVLPQRYPHAREIAQLAADDGVGCAVAPEAALPVYLRDRVTALP